MLSIQTNNGELDVYEGQEIEMQWKSWRFSKGISEPFSNDFRIPKTQNNIRILECYSLLDNPNQVYGNEIKPATITLSGNTIRCYIQVVRVYDTYIDICVFNDTFPKELYYNEFNRTDTDETIFDWNTNTRSYYTDYFKRYGYGIPYNTNYAQYHPSMSVNDILSMISESYGVNLPVVSQSYRLLATKKTVCPQNRRQAVNWFYNNGEPYFTGGQHIVNDVTKSKSDSVTFNRKSKARIRFYVSYLSSSWRALSTLAVKLNGNPIVNIRCSTYDYNKGIELADHTTEFRSGDILTVEFLSPAAIEDVTLLMDIEYYDYEITDEDYGTPLEYTGSCATMYVCQINDDYMRAYFDGSVYRIGHTNRPIPTEETYQTLQTYHLSYSYFGYFCNLNKMMIRDFLYALSLIYGKSLSFSSNGVSLSSVDKSDTITDAEMDYISPTTDELGMRNVIVYGNGYEREITERIDNSFLSESVSVIETNLARCEPDRRQGMAVVPQYSNAEYDADTGEYSADFSELEGIYILDTRNGYLTPLEAKYDSLCFSKIKSVIEVEVSTYLYNAMANDFVYIDGRKYMVIDGQTDMRTGKTVLRALLLTNN